MNTKKIIITFLLAVFIVFAISNNIYAANLAATIDVVANKTEVQAGDEVTFAISIKDIANAEDNLVTAAEGVLTYDTNFFEKITTSSIAPSGANTIDVDTGKFVSFFSANTGTTTNIATITLKVKSTATGSGNVTFSKLSSSDGETEAQSADKTIIISIKAASGSSSDSSGTGSSSSGSSTSGSSETDSSSSGSSSSDSSSSISSNSNNNASSLPYTGTSINLCIIGSILVIISIGTISFVKYNKNKNI